MRLKPIRSEKSLREAASGRYTFAVDRLASKTDIKRGVEKLFGVQVTSIRTSRSRWDGKRAIVTVKSGQKIDLFETS